MMFLFTIGFDYLSSFSFQHCQLRISSYTSSQIFLAKHQLHRTDLFLLFEKDFLFDYEKTKRKSLKLCQLTCLHKYN